MSRPDIRRLLRSVLRLAPPAERRVVEEARAADAHVGTVVDLLERQFSAEDVPVPELPDLVAAAFTEAARRGPLARIVPVDRGRRLVRRLAPLAAAASLAVGTLWVALAPGGPRPAVEVASGTASLEPGARRLAPGTPAAMDDGAAVAVNPDGATRLALPGGGTLLLAGPARLELGSFAVRDGKTTVAWQLDGGTLGADLPPGVYHAFGVTTPHARITVVGTAFSLDVAPDRTRLRVARGSVRATPLDRPEAARTLESGQAATITRQALEMERAGGTALPSDTRPAETAFTERIHLVNGMVITGKIVSQDGTTLVVRTASGPLRIDRTKVQYVDTIK